MIFKAASHQQCNLSNRLTQFHRGLYIIFKNLQNILLFLKFLFIDLLKDAENHDFKMALRF